MNPHGKQTSTLGDVLYANARRLVSEHQWVALVRSIATGDQLALHALYERAHRLVFTVSMRITGSRDIAEDVTVAVFYDVWRRASGYDAARATVVAWIMDLARTRASERRRVQPRKAAERQQGEGLRVALAALTSGERQVLEAAFFGDLTYVDMAARLNQPVGTVKSRIRSGLHSLSSAAYTNPCDNAELVCAYAVHALPAREILMVEAHLTSCWRCRDELDTLRPLTDRFSFSPRPSGSLQARLALRIAAETGGKPMLPAAPHWFEPEWEEVAPGISCKLLAADAEAHRVSMLVRLAPGGEYPPHTHAGLEELHLLQGELWIDERKLYPGDYNRAEAGTGDSRVWSEAGCTCVLITSTRDILL
jgi:RNA polymerase sigma-70 factor (ECF subfamily)